MSHRDQWALLTADVRHPSELAALNTAVESANEASHEQAFSLRGQDWYSHALVTFAEAHEDTRARMHLHVDTALWFALEAHGWLPDATDALAAAEESDRTCPLDLRWTIEHRTLRVVAISPTELLHADLNGAPLTTEDGLWQTVTMQARPDRERYPAEHDVGEIVHQADEDVDLTITARQWQWRAACWTYTAIEAGSPDSVHRELDDTDLRPIRHAA